MKNEINCPKCGTCMPYTHGSHTELIARIELLEHKLYTLNEENKDLRLLISKL